ncbi:MAG: hypothetical protein MUC47_02250 [Candidatus Kapabacteria bacterium]|jgi:hypothetical protein|nr:hypothetical protein [Candidatus Kapabacteria bacterium]
MFTVRALFLAASLLVGLWALVSCEVDFFTAKRGKDAVLYNPYQLWWENRLAFYYNKLDSFSKITSPVKKMTMRHAFNFDLIRLIDERLRVGDTLLLPPRAYANSYTDGREAIWTDVRIYRYLSNSTTPLVAWENVGRRPKANIAVALVNGEFELLRRGDAPERYDSLVAVYQKASQ